MNGRGTALTDSAPAPAHWPRKHRQSWPSPTGGGWPRQVTRPSPVSWL